jgi:adhesin transport system outer membrane protein
LRNLRYYIVLSIICSLHLNATSLRNSVEDTLNSNPSIIAEHLNRDAYELYIRQEEADYLPTLDLDAYYEKSETRNAPDETPPARGKTRKEGWNAILKLEHVLYDGGLTPSQVLEYQYKYNSNKYRSLYAVENTILDTVNAYIDLVSRQELVSLSKHNIKLHENYLTIAQEKEAISGEVLETYQVNSKYHSVLDRFLEQENEESQAKNLYEKLVGKKLIGNICRPNANESFLPTTLEEAIKVGIRRSYKVKEQIEKTKEQKEKIVQEKAGYKPTLKLQFQSELDNDLELAENGRQDIHSARLYLSWNLFNGGKTHYMTQKETIFLKEEQKKLDAVTDEVIDEIKASYETFYNSQKRIKNLILYEEDNFNIVKIYKKQLADGTRTFIDILNAEAELYRSSIDKTQKEFDYIGSYYDLLFKMSMLSDVILMEEKQVCSTYKFIPKDTDVKGDTEDDSLSDDLLNMFDEKPTAESIKIKIETPVVDKSRLDNLYNNEEKVKNITGKYTIRIGIFPSEKSLKVFVTKNGLLDDYSFFILENGYFQLTYGQYNSVAAANKVKALLNKKALSNGAYVYNVHT